MTLVFILLALFALLECLTWLPLSARQRPLVTSVALVGCVTASLVLVYLSPSIITAIVLLSSGYRVFNLVRGLHSWSLPEYLNAVTRRTSQWLIGIQMALLSVYYAWNVVGLDSMGLWYGFWLLQLLLAGILAETTASHLRSVRPSVIKKAYIDRDLPAITVAIPARNETTDLEACLQSLIASKYPKLEIVVLDDCSQNKRTPEIIRQFAHDGVRFIAGKVPPEQWLAKNYAYEQLAKSANGQLILFCGVDTRFDPLGLRRIVETMLDKNKQMVSVIPENQTPALRATAALLVQPGRYMWELALPRRWLNRPAVLSTCWVITKELLHEAGGFSAVSRSSSPESFFARKAIEAQDGYSFFESTPLIGLRSVKSLSEQRATATRTRYPQLHRRPEVALLLTLAELSFVVAPFGVLAGALVTRDAALTALSLSSCGFLTYSYARVMNLTYRRFLLRSLWLLPFAALYDVGLLHYSMYQYEFSIVSWKGRNVCIPVMRVIPRFPHLPGKQLDISRQ